MFKKAFVLTRPPLRAKTRRAPNKAAGRRTVSRISDAKVVRAAEMVRGAVSCENEAGGLFQHPA
ncbi:MAG: hypothetical protein OJF51_000310 [Nitrospira sp.]|nr:MAG: hypothetical protein OJF51_000310 [Nitrospira sp.]